MAMGHFSEEALKAYNELCAGGIEFSEDSVYDFARCVRSDGSFYGTRGKCKKGKEAGDKKDGEDKVAKARTKVAEAKASGDKKKLAAARHDLQIAERTRKIEDEAKKRGVSVDDVVKERNAKSETKIQGRLAKEQGERVKRLQGMAADGDKRAKDILKRLRDSGRV